MNVHMPVTSVSERAVAYDMPGVTVSNDLFKIYQAAGEAVRRARSGKGPSLLEVKSLRWHGHFVGDAQKYRPAENIAATRKDDCLLRLEKRLMKDKVIMKKDALNIQKKQIREIEAAVAFARRSPAPDPAELMEDLYV